MRDNFAGYGVDVWLSGRMAFAQRRMDVRRFRDRATRMGSLPLTCRPLGNSAVGFDVDTSTGQYQNDFGISRGCCWKAVPT